MLLGLVKDVLFKRKSQSNYTKIICIRQLCDRAMGKSNSFGEERKEVGKRKKGGKKERAKKKRLKGSNTEGKDEGEAGGPAPRAA